MSNKAEDLITIRKNSVEFNHTRIIKRNDGIIEVICGEDVCYEISHFKEMNEAVTNLCSNKKHSVLFIAGQYTSVSNDARIYGATKEATQLSKAEAYVINSIAQHLLANFYLKFNKPAVPTKFFKCRKEAELWLKNYN